MRMSVELRRCLSRKNLFAQGNCFQGSLLEHEKSMYIADVRHN